MSNCSENGVPQRETKSFLMAREPSIDRRYRPRPKRQVRLFDGIEEEDGGNNVDSDCSTSTYGDTEDYMDEESTEQTAASAVSSAFSPAEDGALVYLRLRPVAQFSQTYEVAGDVLVVGPSTESASTSNNKNTMQKHYSFSDIFESNVCQKAIYEKCIADKISADESFTVLTYGTSGSGKTFTLLGDDTRPGIIPRSIENIFSMYANNIYPHPTVKLIKGQLTLLEDKILTKEEMFRNKILSVTEDINSLYRRQHHSILNDHAFETKDLDISVLIWVSFVEIYNECVYDLLTMPTSTNNAQAPPRCNLKIIANDGKVFIKGLTSVYVKSSVEALKLLHHGLQRVTYASTAVNANSSRSHCVFIVDVIKYYPSGEFMETSFKFCDLAGSERLDKTGNVGSRLKEAQHINTSLMILGRCLDAANTNASKKKNAEKIPFRESKLTMLLQSALLGREKLAMIVNVTPTDKYYEENINVLGFSSIAKNIIFNKPVIKTNKSRYSFANNTNYTAQQKYIEELLQENEGFRTMIDKLSLELEEAHYRHYQELAKKEKDVRNELVESFRKTLQEQKEQAEARLNRERELLKRLHQSELESIKRKHEDELEDLRDEMDESNDDNDKENGKELEIDQPKKRKTLS